MIQVIGDEIYFENVKVATLEPKVWATLRARFVEKIEGVLSDDERERAYQEGYRDGLREDF